MGLFLSPFFEQGIVTPPCGHDQLAMKTLAAATPGLDGVAVGAEGDHLGWIIRAAHGQVVDVVDLQDRVACVCQVLDVAGAAWVLAVALAAEQDGTASRV